MRKTVLSAVLFSALFADFTLEYELGNKERQIVQYKDAQHVKITTKQPNGRVSDTLLIVGEKKYAVVMEGGKKRYINIAPMLQKMKQMQAMMSKAYEEETVQTQPTFTILHKGKKTKVAGVNAEIWSVKVNSDVQTEPMEVVVSKDKKLVDAVHKYMDTMGALSGMDEEGQRSLTEFMDISKGYVAISFEGMKLVKYSSSTLPDSLYALPKKLHAKQKSHTKKTKNEDKEIQNAQKMLQNLFGQ